MDLSIADVNLNTELDFLIGAGAGFLPGQFGAVAGQIGGMMGVEKRLDAHLVEKLSYNPGINAARRGLDHERFRTQSWRSIRRAGECLLVIRPAAISPAAQS